MNAVADDRVPLVVDVDGTLLRTDLLWEGLLRMMFERPHRIFGALLALPHGRSAFKTFVADCVDVRCESLPLDPAVLELVEQARRRGRTVVLASAAARSQVVDLARRVPVDRILASEPDLNLKGRRKLDALQNEFDSFDYVGDHHADLPLLASARRPYVVRPSPRLLRRLRSVRPDVQIIGTGERSGVLGWLRSLRPHQWAKNTLLFLPALAAHVPWSPGLWTDLLLGFVSFSAGASALYILNDLADLPYDRSHPLKRKRPLAAGSASIRFALAATAGMLTLSILLAVRLDARFAAVLVTYLLLNASYSMLLKRVVVLDVIVLASLYTIRILAGAVLVDIQLSQWFLAFSIFLFLSLALLKRATELRRMKGIPEGESLPGRGYRVEDASVLLGAGAAAAMASALVYCLYIAGPDVRLLYTTPDLLFLGLPILLYWKLRIWLLAFRGRVDDDPVIFALRDRVSYVCLAAFFLTVWLAR